MMNKKELSEKLHRYAKDVEAKARESKTPNMAFYFGQAVAYETVAQLLESE